MAHVTLTGNLRQFTGGVAELEVEAASVRQLFDRLRSRFPAWGSSASPRVPSTARSPMSSGPRGAATRPTDMPSTSGAKVRLEKIMPPLYQQDCGRCGAKVDECNTSPSLPPRPSPLVGEARRGGLQNISGRDSPHP